LQERQNFAALVLFHQTGVSNMTALFSFYFVNAFGFFCIALAILLTLLTVSYVAYPWIVRSCKRVYFFPPVHDFIGSMIGFFSSVARFIANLFSGMFHGATSFFLEFTPYVLITLFSAVILLAVVNIGMLEWTPFILPLLARYASVVYSALAVMMALFILAFLLCASMFVNDLITDNR
jgi:hypothetical protein